MVVQGSGIRSYTLVESLVVGIYCLILLVAVLTQFFQSQFINVNVMGPILGWIGFGLFFHILYLFNINKWSNSKWVHGFLFALNAAVTSGLIYFSGLNQSMFFFIYLVNILAAGMIFHGQGSLLVALLSSFLFNVVMLVGPEVKGASFLFILALNNLAFYAVASLSGFLSEQLNLVGGELARVGRSLIELKNFNELLLTQVPVGILSCDRTGAVAYSNPSVHRCVGDDSNLTEFTKVLLASERASQEIKWKNEKIFEVYGSSFRVENEELGKVFVVSDVTEYRLMQEKMRAQERLAAVGQLAAGIAHEIRNPLASISGSVEMLSQQAGTEDDRKLFKIVLKETQRLNNLITEFLDYARPSQLDLQIFDLSALLREVLDSVNLNLGLVAGVEQSIELPSGVNFAGDRDKLKQVFLNLVINAFQSMQGRNHRRISISVSRFNEGARVRIEDTGSGMSEETKRRLFEPFYTTKPKGTGLGLAVTHKILEMHRCQMKVESQLEVGTTFELTFSSQFGEN